MGFIQNQSLAVNHQSYNLHAFTKALNDYHRTYDGNETDSGDKVPLNGSESLNTNVAPMLA